MDDSDLPKDLRGMIPKYVIFKLPSGYRDDKVEPATVEGIALPAVAGPAFVLSYGTDRHARAALQAYARSCRVEYPQLAADIDQQLNITSPVDDLEDLRKKLNDGKLKYKPESITPSEFM